MATQNGERSTSPIQAIVFALAMPLFAFAAVAQETVDSPLAQKEAVPVEVFQGPQVKYEGMPAYPPALLTSGIEGWVEVGFMVDPKGNTYELTVLNASDNNKLLHKYSLNAAERWTFDPATLNGEPIDSALSRKIVLKIHNAQNGANSGFVKAYRAFAEAVNEKDQAKADAAMKKMTVQNLYEDAYFGLAQFMYAQVWGTATQQLAGLRRAVAGEDSARYLPKETFAFALQSMFALEVRLQDFAAALYTWVKMQKSGMDKDRLAALKPTVDKILILKKDNRAYKVSGNLVDGSWNYLLFKKTFRINVSQGRLSQIKLRCDKSYVFFQFDPAVEYKVADKYGTCGLELVGDHDTKIELTQS